MPSVNYEDLEMAVHFVSSGYLVNAMACVSRQTGKILWKSDDGTTEDSIPDDIDNPDLYAFVPSQRDLELGKRLVLKFVSNEMPEKYEEVFSVFRRKGAYSKFKVLLDRAGKLEKWYQFEQSALETAIVNWAENEGFSVEKNKENAT